MLSQLFCPTCGGPALQQAHEISCALCGNQSLPEAQPVESEKSSPTEMPAVLEFEVSESGREHSLEELGLAVEYLLGFMDTYPELPKSSLEGATTKVSYTPTLSQGAALFKLCTKFQVRPEALASLAVQLYERRDI